MRKAPAVALDCRVCKESLECPDRPVKEDLEDRKDNEEPRAALDPPVKLVSKASAESGAAKEHKETKDRLVLLDQLARTVFQASVVREALPGSQERSAHRDLLESSDPWVHAVRPDKRELRESQAQPVRPESQASQGHRAKKELEDHQVLLEPLEILDPLDKQEKRARGDLQVLLAKRERRETWVSPESLGQEERRETLDFPV